MFGLLGLTIDRKKGKLLQQYEEKLNRMLYKVTSQAKSQQRQELKMDFEI